MRYKIYLQELSLKATKTPIKVIHSYRGDILYEFMVDDFTYRFHASLAELPASLRHLDPTSIYEVQFFTPDIGDKKSMQHAVKVFAAVGQSLKMFIKEWNPNSFFFKGINPGLRTVYKRFAPMIAKEIKYKHDFDGEYHVFTKP